MADFVFSQLESISNDTFNDFLPYSPSHDTFCLNGSRTHGLQLQNEYFHFDKVFMSDDVYLKQYGEFTNGSSEETVFSHPSEIKLREIELQDHNGQRLEHRRINDIKLKLLSHFFGIEYEDSLLGRAVSQFYPSDIITVVRQCDRIGIFIQFRRFLTCRKYTESLFNGMSHLNNLHFYYKDSPFVNCMYMILEFVEEAHINHVFNYLLSNEHVNSNLKMIYNQWMFCSNICTASDVHLISLSLSSVRRGDSKLLQDAVNVSSENKRDDVCDLADQFDSAVSIKVNTEPTQNSSHNQRQIGWARSAIINAHKSKNTEENVNTSDDDKSITYMSNAVIAHDKIEAVLPPVFATISKEVRDFALLLLKEGRLQIFQFSVLLCEALAIAETAQAKIRAKSVLYKLSQYPVPVQLSNASQVARYILGSMIRTQEQQQQNSENISNNELQNIKHTESSDNNPPVIKKRNSYKKVSMKSVEYGGEHALPIMNREDTDGCIIS